MANQSDIKLLSFKDIENERESNAVNQKYDEKEEKNCLIPNDTTQPPPSDPLVPEPQKKQETIKPIHTNKRKKCENNEKIKRKKCENNEKINEKLLTEIVSFLPQRKRKEGKEYIKKLMQKEGLIIKKNKVFLNGRKVDHLTALLAKEFLPTKKKSNTTLVEKILKPRFNGILG